MYNAVGAPSASQVLNVRANALRVLQEALKHLSHEPLAGAALVSPPEGLQAVVAMLASQCERCDAWSDIAGTALSWWRLSVGQYHRI